MICEVSQLFRCFNSVPIGKFEEVSDKNVTSLSVGSEVGSLKEINVNDFPAPNFRSVVLSSS